MTYTPTDITIIGAYFGMGCTVGALATLALCTLTRRFIEWCASEIPWYAYTFRKWCAARWRP